VGFSPLIAACCCCLLHTHCPHHGCFQGPPDAPSGPFYIHHQVGDPRDPIRSVVIQHFQTHYRVRSNVLKKLLEDNNLDITEAELKNILKVTATC